MALINTFNLIYLCNYKAIYNAYNICMYMYIL